MTDITLIIKKAGGLQKAEITVADTQTCGDIIQAAVDNWALEKDIDYKITNVSKTPPQTLNPSTTLVTAGVVGGETLEIRGEPVAG